MIKHSFRRTDMSAEIASIAACKRDGAKKWCPMSHPSQSGKIERLVGKLD
jgi:hypothetical protein